MLSLLFGFVKHVFLTLVEEVVMSFFGMNFI
jgi:hypothetical protein